jgi:hypothetical protein
MRWCTESQVEVSKMCCDIILILKNSIIPNNMNILAKIDTKPNTKLNK